MKKHNKPMRLASLLLIVVFVTTCALTGTLARYASEAAVNSQYARVAAWQINLDGSKMGSTFSLNLFDNFIDHDEGEAAEWANTETDFDGYLTTQTSNLFFPGAGGFTDGLTIENLSEVPALITLGVADGVTLTNTLPSDIEFGFYQDDTTAFDEDLANANITWGKSASDIATLIAETDDIILQPQDSLYLAICWRWEFNKDGSADDSDTPIGEAQFDDTTTYELDLAAGDLVLTATQVD